jgi:hypothetical protein
MRVFYCTAAVLATLFGSALLVLQIIGGLEYTAGQSDYVRWSMVAAMVTVALLPIMIDMVWRINKLLAVCLFVGFAAFLAYSLPASIGRIGEVKEAKVLAADDAAQLRAELASVRKTLGYAEPEAARECEGAPEPIPPGKWPECRRKRGTVKALTIQAGRIETRLRDMGNARLGDTSSQLLAWALSPLGISEETIRKGSGMALPIGLEVVIFSLFGSVPAAFRKAMKVKPREVVSAPVEAKSAPAQPRVLPEPTPPKGRRGRKPDVKVIDFVRSYRARHGTDPKAQLLMAEFPDISQSKAYDLAKRA